MHALLIFHFFSFLSSYFLLRCGCFFIFRFAPLYLLLISLFFNNRKCHKNLHVQPTQTLKVGGGDLPITLCRYLHEISANIWKTRQLGVSLFFFLHLFVFCLFLFFSITESTTRIYMYNVQPTQTLKVGGKSAYHSLRISARSFCKYMKDKAIGQNWTKSCNNYL